MSLRKCLPSLVCAIWVASASAQSFNINVIETGGNLPSNYAAAGLPGFWNVSRADHVTPFTTGPHPQDLMLVDIYGNQTTVGFHQFGGEGHFTASDPALSGNNAILMNDGLTTHSLVLESCMYLNGLQNGSYEVLVYAWMPQQPTVMQEVRFDFHPGIELVGGTWPGQHQEGITYSRHLIEVTNGNMGFHVGIPDGGDTGIGAAFNGFQVRYLDAGPVPMVSEWGLIIMAALLVLTAGVVVRRRTKATPAAA